MGSLFEGLLERLKQLEPASEGEPIKYEVHAFGGAKDKRVAPPVYLIARSPALAEAAGRKLHRMLGTRGKFRTRAVPYNPLHDPAWHGYVRPLTENHN